MGIISKPVNLSTEANLLYEIYRTLSRIHIVGGSGGSGVQSVTGTLVDNTDPNNPVINTPSFAETLAEDNKTNDIPIVSNNGLAVVDVNDAYLLLGYDNGGGSSNISLDGISAQIYGLILASIYSGDVIKLDAGTAIIIGAPAVDIDTSILKYNAEEVATQPWVTSQGYGTGTVTSVTGVGGETTVATGTTTPVIGISSTYTSARDAYADAKVADTISDGVTTVAPSQNAVFDALQFTRRLITKGTGSVTGTLTETILTSLLIPANTLDSSCFIWSTMDFFKTNAGSVTARLYINSANTLTGATLLGLVTLGSTRNASFNRKYYLNGTSLDLLTSSTVSQTNNEFLDALFGASTVLTVNPANDIYFIYTAQNDATGTVATNKMATVQKMKL